MSDPITGAETSLAIVNEAVEGVPAKVTKLLNYVSGSFERNMTTLKSNALTNSPAEFSNAIHGPVTLSGQFRLDAGYEGGFPFVMNACFGTPTTTQINAVGGTPVRYRHRWPNRFSEQSVTMVQQKGEEFHVHPGVKGMNFELSAAADGTDVLQASVTLAAMDVLLYNVDSQIGMDTASVDTLDPIAQGTDGTFLIDGVEYCKARVVSLTHNTGRVEKRVLRNFRGPKSHFKQRSNTRITFEQYFEDAADILRQFGTPGATARPIGAKKRVVPAEVKFVITSPNNANNVPNEYVLCVPRGVWDAVGDPVQGPEAIMQTVEVTPLKDLATGTDFYQELVNQMTHAAITATGVAISNTAAAGSTVQSY